MYVVTAGIERLVGFQWKMDIDASSLALDRINPDPSAVAPDPMSRHGQSQAGSLPFRGKEGR
jgi:hypothetical protein